jgi:hypothetical protein
MASDTFFAHHGEVSRIVAYFAALAGEVAERILGLLRRHSAGVCDVRRGRWQAFRRREAVSLSLTHSAICSERIGRLCHMWTPPFGKDFYERLCKTVGCSHMSGLCARLLWPLALMISAD